MSDDAPVTLEQVEAYFIREGIHTYQEILQVLENTDEELEQVEKQRDEALAALAVSDKQHHECIDKLHALRKKIADAPHAILCDHIWRGRGNLDDRAACTCWKSAAPIAEQRSADVG